MPRNMSKEIQEVLSFIREHGEMKYQDVVDHFNSTGRADHVSVLPQLYQRKQTKQRLVSDETGKLVLMVKVSE